MSKPLRQRFSFWKIEQKKKVAGQLARISAGRFTETLVSDSNHYQWKYWQQTLNAFDEGGGRFQPNKSEFSLVRRIQKELTKQRDTKRKKSTTFASPFERMTKTAAAAATLTRGAAAPSPEQKLGCLGRAETGRPTKETGKKKCSQQHP